MKFNNKGFMLVEVIVTSTVVITSMIALYTGFNKLYNNYRVRNGYYNLDGVYATREVVNSMIKSNNINKFISQIFYEKTYGYLIKDNICDNNYAGLSYNCSAIQKLYGIENMIFAEYDSKNLESLKTIATNQTFKDYIDYLITYYDIEATETEYNYIVFTEMKVGDDHYYANLRMR